jgi:hypothetical protein
MSTLNTISVFNLDTSYREEALSQISQQIADKFGRQEPAAYRRVDFELNRDHIVDKMRRKGVYSEQDFPSNKRKLLKFVRKFFTFSDLSSSTVEERSNNDDEERAFISRRYPIRPRINVKRLPATRKVLEREERNFLTPKEVSKQTGMKMEHQRVVERYLLLIEPKVRRLQAKYDEYRKRPETHPLYSEEFSKFCHRRRQELTESGVDAASHNFTSEWIPMFAKRLEDLHRNDVDMKKMAVRRKLHLHPDELTAIESSIGRVRINYKEKLKLRKQKVRKVDTKIDGSDGSSSSEDYRGRRRPSYEMNLKALFGPDKPAAREPAERICLLQVCHLLETVRRDLDKELYAKVNALHLRALEMEKVKRYSGDDLLFDKSNMQVLIDVKSALYNLREKDWITPMRKGVLFEAIQDIYDMQTIVFSRMEIMDEAKMQAVDEEFYHAKNLFAKTLAESPYLQDREGASNEEFEEALRDVLFEYHKEFSKPDIDLDTTDFSCIDKMGDESLIQLIRYFTDLTKSEQDMITAYLLKLERTDPDKADYFRTFENLGDEDEDQ